MKRKRNVSPDSTSDAFGSNAAETWRVRNFYTREEDFKLWLYIRDQMEKKDGKVYLSGNEFWMKMERKSVILGRSWMSLRDRYIHKMKRKHLPWEHTTRSRNKPASSAPSSRRMKRERCRIFLSEERPCTSTVTRGGNRSNRHAANSRRRSVNDYHNPAPRSHSPDENTGVPSSNIRSNRNRANSRRVSVNGDDDQALHSDENTGVPSSSARSNRRRANLRRRSVDGDDIQAPRSHSPNANTGVPSSNTRSNRNRANSWRRSVNGDDNQASRSQSPDENTDVPSSNTRSNRNRANSWRRSVNGDDNQAPRFHSPDANTGVPSSNTRSNRNRANSRRRSVNGDYNQAPRSQPPDENTDVPISSTRSNRRRANLRCRSVNGDDYPAPRSHSDENTDVPSSSTRNNRRKANLRRRSVNGDYNPAPRFHSDESTGVLRSSTRSNRPGSNSRHRLLNSDDSSSSSADENPCASRASVPCMKCSAVSSNRLENVVVKSTDDEDGELSTTYLYQSRNDGGRTETDDDEPTETSSNHGTYDEGGLMRTADDKGEQTLEKQEDGGDSSSDESDNFDEKLLKVTVKDSGLKSTEELKVVEMVNVIRRTTKATLLQTFFSLFRTGASLEDATAFLEDRDTKNVWRLEEDKVLMEKDEEKIRNIIDERGCFAVEKRLDFLEGFGAETENESGSTPEEEHEVLE